MAAVPCCVVAVWLCMFAPTIHLGGGGGAHLGRMLFTSPSACKEVLGGERGQEPRYACQSILARQAG